MESSVLDNRTPSQPGEAGHYEYGWSRNLEEKIYQFFCQTTRTTVDRVNELGDILHDIIADICEQYDTDMISRKNKIDMLSILYKMIGLTRDIIDGKGEYTLSYMMIYTWYFFYPTLAEFALQTFVFSYSDNEQPYGSWKDMKYFCNYLVSRGCFYSHPLILFCMDLVNEQLTKDHEDYSLNYPISLAAKWIPNEKSNKFGWFYKQLAVDYFSHYLVNATTPLQNQNATKKCYTEYRKLCGKLNKYLDTVQIKQCANKWATIVPSKQTSITMHKQKNAFLNKTKSGLHKEDRIQCANHFKEYIDKALNGEVIIKGKRVGMNDFTKDAIRLLSTGENNQDKRNIVNLQWEDSSRVNHALTKMVAMIDVSASMFGDPLHAAIALGLRIAEKSILGKRVLTFSASPNWINLDSVDTLVDMVEKVKAADWGTNANIYSAFKMICEAIEASNLSKEEASDITLVILSDMQVGPANTKAMSLYNEIEQIYTVLGKKKYGESIKPPHILFWNLRSTNGFPVLSSQPNVSSISGFNTSFLNLFCEKGQDLLTGIKCSPWTIMLETLNNDRYSVLELKLRDRFIIE